jgi:hypothetical protein
MKILFKKQTNKQKKDNKTTTDSKGGRRKGEKWVDGQIKIVPKPCNG